MKMSRTLNRRGALVVGAWSAAGVVAGRCLAEPAADAKGPSATAPSTRIGLGFSLYGMRSLNPVEALGHCRELGYDCVELPVMREWPADSATWDAVERRKFVEALGRHRLRLSAIMENLPLAGPREQVDGHLERLRRALALARELSAERPPVVETILGGSPAQWETGKQELLDRLGAWSRVAESLEGVVAIKPHVAGIMHRPEHAVWLLERLRSRAMRCAYDFSHYQLRSIPLAETLDALQPWWAFAHVKDARGDSAKFEFLLPGEGTTDYEALLRGMVQGKYAGDVVVEVSGQISTKPGYDPVAAARRSYAALSAAWRAAGLERAG